MATRAGLIRLVEEIRKELYVSVMDQTIVILNEIGALNNFTPINNYFLQTLKIRREMIEA